MRTVVVGVGNPILGDDGVGIHVARELKGKVDVDVREAYTGGLNLLDLIIGYDRAVLVDAVYLDGMRAGEVKALSLDDLESAHSSNPHDATLMEAIEVSKRMGGGRIPRYIVLVGIRIEPVKDFSETLSPAVEASIPDAVREVMGLLSP
ncbi:MAG: hypothetical protein DRN57_09010 [Thermoplasmata archaeon]|nr:MAG: hypothetical protein DRN57_09010 [Thermoplasmata archaeon]